MERNRILALVLALVLVAGIMPIHAFAAEPLDFSDVPEGFWAEEAIDYMSSNGYLLGNKDGTFGPTDSIMRKTVALLLYRIEGQPAVSGSMPFPDVGGKTYHDAILWASQAGIVTGYGDGTFRPDNTISRQHFAIMLYRYANYKACGLVGDENKALADFSDEASISKASKEACLWAYQNGIISGRANGTFDPNGTTTRAQLAVIMSRFLKDFYVYSIGEDVAHEHSYTNWNIIIEPTIDRPGYGTRTCNICGIEESQAFYLLGTSTENTTGFDYAAIAAYGNAYAEEKYGWKIDVSMNAENSGGYNPHSSIQVADIIKLGGEDYLLDRIAEKVDTTYSWLVTKYGSADIATINCHVWEEGGWIKYIVFFGGNLDNI